MGGHASVVNGFDGDVFRVIGRLVWGATEQQVGLELSSTERVWDQKVSRALGLGLVI